MSRPLRESLGQPGIPTPDAVLERAGAWIYRTALRLRQRMPWAEVDDLVQHGIMVALEMRDRYAPERGVPFDIFIKPRVFGAMVDLLRRAGSMARQDAVAFQRQEGGMAPSALESAIQTEDVTVLAAGIEALPEAERTAISLYYFNELSNKDIARVMQTDESRATRLRQRALARLNRFIVSRSSPAKAVACQQAGKELCP
jgi:RNA polymerase sigma factor for flagellar operon FliA